jgi:hypothetical protein
MSDIIIEIKGDDPKDSVERTDFEPQTSTHLAANVDVTTTTSWADAVSSASWPEGTRSIIISNTGADTVEAGFASGTPVGAHVILPGSQREIFPAVTSPVPTLRVRHK